MRQVRVLQDADITRRRLRLWKLLRCFERTALERLLLFVVTRRRRDGFGFWLLLIYLAALAVVEVLRLYLLLFHKSRSLFSLRIYWLFLLLLLLGLLFAIPSLFLQFSFLSLLVFAPDLANDFIDGPGLRIRREALDFLVRRLPDHRVVLSNVSPQSAASLRVSLLWLALVLKHLQVMLEDVAGQAFKYPFVMQGFKWRHSLRRMPLEASV